MVKNLVVSALVLSSAVPSFAGQGAFQTEAFVSLQRAAEGGPNAMGRLSDNSAQGASMEQGSVSARTLGYRESDAPRVTRVNHTHDRTDGFTYRTYPKGETAAGRGYNWMLHPATEMLDSENLLVKIAGGIAYGVLFIPALFAAGVNALIGGRVPTQY